MSFFLQRLFMAQEIVEELGFWESQMLVCGCGCGGCYGVGERQGLLTVLMKTGPLGGVYRKKR